MQLIIHADDFGKNVDVTRAIIEAMSRGWCTETSLMVNMPYADEAVQLAKENGFSHRVGLHLNLTQGRPLTRKIRDCPNICNAEGLFNKKFHIRQFSRFIFSPYEREALQEEIRAQLMKFLSYGKMMNRIDSHHHVHTDWGVYTLLKPLAREFDFGGMRISATLHKVSLPHKLYKWLYNWDVKRYFETRSEFDGFVPEIARAVNCGKRVEMMVHPMYSPDGVLMDTHTNYEKIISFLNKEGVEIEYA